LSATRQSFTAAAQERSAGRSFVPGRQEKKYNGIDIGVHPNMMVLKKVHEEK